MKKIFYCFLLLTFFVLSCSKEEADMDGSQNKETENKEIKIILEAETSSQNIFAPIVFYQSFDFGKDAPCLSEVYDSIVWKSSHSPNSFKVFSHSNYARYVETTFFKWAHVYYSPGTYKYGLQPIFDGKLLKRLFYLSVWSMLHSFISMAPWFLFFIAIEHLGKMELAVSNITRSVSTLFFCDCQFFRSHQRFLGKQSFRSRTTKRCFSYLPQNHQNGICHRFSAGRSRIVL